MRCNHPNKKEIWYLWVTETGSLINFQAGAGKVKKQYVCMICGKNTRAPK